MTVTLANTEEWMQTYLPHNTKGQLILPAKQNFAMNWYNWKAADAKYEITKNAPAKTLTGDKRSPRSSPGFTWKNIWTLISENAKWSKTRIVRGCGRRRARGDFQAIGKVCFLRSLITGLNVMTSSPTRGEQSHFLDPCSCSKKCDSSSCSGPR